MKINAERVAGSGFIAGMLVVLAVAVRPATISPLYVALRPWMERFGGPVFLLLLLFMGAVYAAYRGHLSRLREQKGNMEQIAGVHLRTIEALALAIEATDQNTHNHLRRVRVYADELGKELGLQTDEMEALRAAALLHDIGKLAVPEYIVNKPGKLTPEEFEKMKMHPLVGAEILERVNFPYPVVPIVRSHHERWDGKGYPDGLTGEQIPIGARILSAVDCLDALASDRPYRRATSLEEAMAHVSRLSGTQFDPHVVEILERRCAELEGKARDNGTASIPLHLDHHVKRGEQPGAGYEENGAPVTLSPGHMADRNTLALAHRETEMLAQLTQALESSLALDESLGRFADRLKQLISYETFAVYMRQGDKLLPKFVRGEDRQLFSSLQIPMGEGLSGWVAQNRRSIVNGNPSVEPGYLNDATKFSKLRSALAVPLENTQNELRGVMVLYAAAPDAFTSGNLHMLEAISPKVASSIEDAIRYHLAEMQASVDYLTLALNSRAFLARMEDEVKRCAEAEAPLSLVLCDIDAFGEVNADFGHTEGNRLLTVVAGHFRDTIREGDVLGRLGGDEFALLMPGLDGQTAEARIRDLRIAMRNASTRALGEEHPVTATFSMAFFPDSGQSAEELLAAADKGLQRAKQARTLRSGPELTIGLAVAQA